MTDGKNLLKFEKFFPKTPLVTKLYIKVKYIDSIKQILLKYKYFAIFRSKIFYRK